MLAEGMSETIIQPGITSLYLSSQKMMTEKTSLLQAFLEQEWPEWRDDDFARARFKAFTGQKQDWEERINFWRDAIVKVARHLDLLIIDTKEVTFVEISPAILRRLSWTLAASRGFSSEGRV